MRKILMKLLLVIIFSASCFTQELINLETEVLKEIAVGTKKNQIYYLDSGEDIYKCINIQVTDTGALVIPSNFLNSEKEYKVFYYKENFWTELEEGTNKLDWSDTINQNGFTFNSFLYIWNNEKLINYDTNKIPNIRSSLYILPCGGIFYSKKSQSRFYILDFSNGSFSKVIENYDEVNEWLSKNPGNFCINKDTGKIQKNGFNYEEHTEENVGAYSGKLKSDHNLYLDKNGIQITNSKGILELSLKYPTGISCCCKGVGTWGEIYMILIPELIEISKGTFSTKEGDVAKLVVIRNHLKYFGILNDDRIRLRKGPGTDTESLGTYPIKTGFRIIEDSGVKQTIDGVTDTWVKVRLLDGTEGYFFGQYVQNLYDGPGTPLPWPNVADWD